MCGRFTQRLSSSDFARFFEATEPQLDIVIDNAGAIYPDRTVGPDRIEATLATLVVGPFVLVGGLLPLLRCEPGPDARVVCVTSGGMYTQALRLDDLQWEREPYSGPRAYARAKREQTALVREWARRLAWTGVTVNAMHPGLGGHAGARGISARLLPVHGAAPENATAGRRHARLARHRPCDGRAQRRALSGTAASAIRQDPGHAPVGGRAAAPVGCRSSS